LGNEVWSRDSISVGPSEFRDSFRAKLFLCLRCRPNLLCLPLTKQWALLYAPNTIYFLTDVPTNCRANCNTLYLI
jgi:hypothetical protein